mgnify:CR=1 FL=1
MKKITLLFAAVLASMAMTAQTTEISEGFEDVAGLSGYDFVNVGDAPGTNTWGQPDGTVFESFDGDPGHYVANNFNSAGGSVINDFMILPAFTLNNGDYMTFYTRTVDASGFPDRLEVRINPDGSEVFPVDETDVGSWTQLLTEINPALDNGGYPEDWTQFTSTITDLTGPTDIRFAFRYWVTDAGPSGANSNFIGIDRVEVISGVLGVDTQVFSNFNYYVDANNRLNITNGVAMDNVALYNVLGQEIMNRAISTTNEVVDMASLTSGVYMVRVQIGGSSQTFKVVKK